MKSIDNAHGTYNKNAQIKFKISVLKSGFCDYSYVYIIVSGTITITAARADDNAKWLDQRNKRVIFRNNAPFNDCTSKKNDPQTEHAKDLDVVILMYNLIQYSHNYLKTSQSLWQYYKDMPNDILAKSESFKFKMRITRKTPATGNTKDVKIAALLKCLSNF